MVRKNIQKKADGQKNRNLFMTVKDTEDIVKRSNLKVNGGASLVAQWLRIYLPMQGTWVRALVQEDPTCHGVTKPMRHNY